jgi:methenyltetrahydrofolate cyclohydrolase
VSPLADQPLAELLASVAAPTPAPAGGAAAAWACALAAGLVEMAAAIGGDTAPERMQAWRTRVAELRAVALALAERDVEAYAAVLASRPGDEPDGDGAALAAAADPPLAVAEAGAEVAELATLVARDGKQSLRGDAITGALIAEAATAAAAALVEINLAARPGDARVLLARAHARRAAAAREEILG